MSRGSFSTGICSRHTDDLIENGIVVEGDHTVEVNFAGGPSGIEKFFCREDSIRGLLSVTVDLLRVFCGARSNMEGP